MTSANHPGILVYRTGNAANDYGRVNGIYANFVPLIDARKTGTKIVWVFRLQNLTQVTFRIGLDGEGYSTKGPANAICLYYDATTSTANW